MKIISFKIKSTKTKHQKINSNNESNFWMWDFMSHKVSTDFAVESKPLLIINGYIGEAKFTGRKNFAEHKIMSRSDGLKN